MKVNGNLNLTYLRFSGKSRSNCHKAANCLEAAEFLLDHSSSIRPSNVNIATGSIT